MPAVLVDVPPPWQRPITQAIQNWNATIPNSFTLSRKGYSVTVRVRSYPMKYAGYALHRHGGHWSVRLQADTTPDQRQQLACHELGHVLGYHHTDGMDCMNPVGLYPNPPKKES